MIYAIIIHALNTIFRTILSTAFYMIYANELAFGVSLWDGGSLNRRSFTFLILQKHVVSFDRIHIWQVSPQLCRGYAVATPVKFERDIQW